MIKFFRQIRYKLVETGKIAKYFKYAIGEIILVVIGILIALQINNWNENRKLKQQKKELINNLISDFASTNEALVAAIKKKEDGVQRMKIFIKNIDRETQTITVDSLRKLATDFFTEENFKSTISSYNEAVSNGSFKLLKSRSLSKYIDKFFEGSDSYAHIYNLGGNSYFNGATWELRKSLGSLQSIANGNYFDALPYHKLSYSEYIKTVTEPEAIATFENSYRIRMSLIRHLKTMKISCDSIISTLNILEEN